ncbi:c-type cytochrome [Mycetohabitans rhizoxinica]|uniref:c-type cytochrome n=1 Tax=Mycetohabitans rhizoxinica TaxID=412963 RepID=UPI003BB0C5D5
MKKRIIEASGVAKAMVAACAAVVSIGAAQAADIGNGRALVERTNCAACHGAELSTPVSPDYPKLAGQHADYTYWTLRQYQMGGGNPSFGRDNAIMAAQVQNLSESDLKDIAAYVESLKGDLVLKK